MLKALEEIFAKRMMILAKLCKFDMEPELLALYDSELEPLGYDKVIVALDSIMRDRNTKDQFPSIREIKQTMGVSVREKISQEKTDQNLADRAVDKIFAAIKKFGAGYPDSRLEEFREYVGSVGRVVIRQYGWQEICGISGDNVPIFRAQMRRSAVAVIRASRDGSLNEVPELPEPISKSNTFALRALDEADKSVAQMKLK